MHQIMPGSVALEGRIAVGTARKMESMGHKVQITGDYSNASAPVVILSKEGALHGGADPRRGRFIFGN